MAGNIGDVRIVLDQIHDLLRLAGASSRQAQSTGDSLAARLAAAKHSAESTIQLLTTANNRGEEALTLIRQIQSQTSHDEPATIALKISQALEQVQRGLVNTRTILDSLDRMIGLSSNTKGTSPANFFNIADIQREQYAARL